MAGAQTAEGGRKSLLESAETAVAVVAELAGASRSLFPWNTHKHQL